MRSLLAFALALAPAAALAEPVALTQLSQVQKLCAELKSPAHTGDALENAQPASSEARQQAMRQEFLIRLPPGQYRISEADPSSGTVTVDTEHAFRLFKGQVVFYPVDEEDLDLHVAEGQALPQSARDLELDLVVRPGQDSEQPCTVGLSKDYVMGVEVLSARLLNKGGTTVAALEEEQGIERQAKAEGAPEVTIEPAVVEGSADLAKQLTQGMNQLRPKLTQCYQLGLAKQPALDGSLVLGFELSSAGKPGQVTVVADSVQDDAVSRCVSDAVAGLSVGGASSAKKKSATNGRASVAVHFERK